jgi:hypothetical protein
MDKESNDKAGEQGGDPLGERDYRFKDEIQSNTKPSWAKAEKDREKLSESWADAERRKEKAHDSFASAEKKAEKKQKPISDKSTVGSSNEAENAVPPPFANKVTGDRWGKNSPLDKASPQIGIPRQLVKKFGPIGLVMGLIVAGALAIFGSQALLPFHVLEMLTEDFDSIQVGNNVRGRRLTKGLLDDRTDATKQKIFSFNGRKYKRISGNRQVSLSEEGVDIFNKNISLLDDVDDLIMFDGRKLKDVPASDAEFSKIFGSDDYKLKQRVMIFDDGSGVKRIIPADNFEEFFNVNPNFRNGYLKGSRTWTGRISGWFDGLVVKFLDKFNLNRGLFKDFIANTKAIEAGNAARKAALREAMGNKGGSKATSMESIDETIEVVKDSQGEEIEIKRTESASASLPENSGVAGARKSAENFKTDVGNVARKAQKIAGIASLATGLTCGVMFGIMAVNLIVAVSELGKVMEYAGAFSESVDKAKAGDGEGSPITEFANILTEEAVPKDVGVDGKTLGTGTSSDIDVESDYLYTVKDRDGATPKTAMEASGMEWSTIGSPANPTGVSEQRYSMESGIGTFLGNSAFGNFIGTMQFIKGCAEAQAAAAMAEAGIAVALLFFPPAEVVYQGLKFLSKIIGFAVAVALPVVLSAILPKLAMIFVEDLVTDIAGEDVGNALVAGLHGYQSGNHLQGGGSGGSKEAVLAFRHEQREVIAMQAEVDRQTYSPFDATNKNTFFGSILSKALPFFGKTPTITKTLSGIGAITANSISTLLPTANALDDVELDDNIGKCPELEAAGAIGDVYCQPYMVSDVQTKQTSPDDIFNKVRTMQYTVVNEKLKGASFSEPAGNMAQEGEYIPTNAISVGSGYTNTSNTSRKHNFYLETDLCDDKHSDHAYRKYVGYNRYEKTPYGHCLDRAMWDGVDNIIPNTYLEKGISNIDVLAKSSYSEYDDEFGEEITLSYYDPSEEGFEVIVPSSNLFFYVTLCGNRASPLGIVDQGVTGSYYELPTGVAEVAINAVKWGIGLIPVIGEAFNAVDSATDTRRQISVMGMGWTNGENCVANNKSRGTGYRSETSWQDELIYYQQYIEDARINENMGAIDATNNPVVAALNIYEAYIPLDDTYEGRLATMSGMKKETVEEYLAVMLDYVNGRLDPTYIASLYPAPYGWGSEEIHSIEELNTQKTVLAKALRKFDGTKIFSMMTFSENRRRLVVDLV